MTTTERKGWRARVSSNRRRIDVELADQPETRKLTSPVLYGLTNQLLPRLRARAKGQFLDAGCGTQPFRAAVEDQVDRYLTFDIEARTDELDFVGDVQDMSAVPDQSIDSLLSSEVLEHVPHPERAIAEFARVLRPGGALFVTVPFLARLHEEPHDYFRYTRYALQRLLDEGGFDVDEIVETGSLFSFMGHQVSLMSLGVTWHVPGLRRVVRWANTLLVVRPCAALDRLSRLPPLLPLGYVVVATRRASTDEAESTPAAAHDPTL